MMPDIADRVASLLSSATTPSVSLSRVHLALVAEVGPALGTYAQLRRELARRTDLFLLLEPRHPLDGALWSGDTRVEYEAALLDTDLDAGLRVALAPPTRTRAAAFSLGEAAECGATGEYAGAPARDAFLRHLDASLVQLWGVTAHDPMIRADLAEAMSEFQQVRKVLSEDG